MLSQNASPSRASTADVLKTYRTFYLNAYKTTLIFPSLQIQKTCGMVLLYNLNDVAAGIQSSQVLRVLKIWCCHGSVFKSTN